MPCGMDVTYYILPEYSVSIRILGKREKCANRK